MTYIIMMAITFFAGSTASFVSYNKSKKIYGDDIDMIELFVKLFISFTASVIWFLTLPAVVIIGAAWLFARLLDGPKKK